MSEIDEIFASKGKGSAAPFVASSSLPEKKEKKKIKKRKRDEPTTSDSHAPETIIDNSNCLTKSKRPKTEAIPKTPRFPKEVDADDVKFADSRGSRPRKKTEEGWSIYKEDELGIGDEGGDTPLCPFDCDCCF